MAGLRRKLAVVPGARLYLVAGQDLRIGGRQSNGAYQFTLQADNSADLYEWAPKLTSALEHDPMLRDVNSDQQQKGLETDVLIDRATASRMDINATEIDNTLYDAFGQRQVSTIYSAQNQYHVIMEVAPRYWQSPQTLRDIYVSTTGGTASGTQTTNAVVGTVAASSSAVVANGSTVAAAQRQAAREYSVTRRPLRPASPPALPVTPRPTRWRRPAKAPLPRPRPSAPAWKRWFRWRRSPASVRGPRRCP